MTQPSANPENPICKVSIKAAMNIAERVECGLTVMPGDVIFLARTYIGLIGWLKQVTNDKAYCQLPKTLQE